MTTSLRVRPPAVSGTFYPDDPDTLGRMVDDDLAAATPDPSPPDASPPALPKAVIAPHAGYRYSGPVAGTAYSRLMPLRGQVERVVLLGPAHRVPVRGMAVPSVDALKTPLGLLPVDDTGRRDALAHECVSVDDAAHAPEHSLEVHLPFIQRTLGEVSVLPFVVGDATPGEVADVLQTVWGGPETLIIVSSDLSHYNDYETAQRLDRRTAEAIVRGDVKSVGARDACGAHPVRGLMEAARRHGLATELVDLRNSGDTAGPRNRVVGYGAFTLTPSDAGEADADADVTITEQDPPTDVRVHAAAGVRSAPEDPLRDESVRRILLDTAVGIIDRHLEGDRGMEVLAADLPPAVTGPGASFVTLEREDRLLGCTGSMVPVRPLVEDVAVRAVTSAFADPRLPSIEREDWHAMSLKISILGPLEEVDVVSVAELCLRVRPGVDGLLIQGAGRRATFLPSVWAKVDDAEAFVALLWRKAGLAAGAWPADMVVEHYSTVELVDPGPR